MRMLLQVTMSVVALAFIVFGFLMVFGVVPGLDISTFTKLMQGVQIEPLHSNEFIVAQQSTQALACAINCVSSGKELPCVAEVNRLSEATPDVLGQKTGARVYKVSGDWYHVENFFLPENFADIDFIPGVDAAAEFLEDSKLVDEDKAHEFLKAIGDPSFLVYFQNFPEGEDIAWKSKSAWWTKFASALTYLIPFDALFGAGLRAVGFVAGKGVAVAKSTARTMASGTYSAAKSRLLKKGVTEATAETVENLAEKAVLKSVADKAEVLLIEKGASLTFRQKVLRIFYKNKVNEKIIARYGGKVDDFIKDLDPGVMTSIREESWDALGKLDNYWLDTFDKTGVSPQDALEQAVRDTFSKKVGKDIDDKAVDLYVLLKPSAREAVEKEVLKGVSIDFAKKAMKRIGAVSLFAYIAHLASCEEINRDVQNSSLVLKQALMCDTHDLGTFNLTGIIRPGDPINDTMAVVLKKTVGSGIFGDDSPFYLASPCHANLNVKGGVASCEIYSYDKDTGAVICINPEMISETYEAEGKNANYVRCGEVAMASGTTGNPEQMMKDLAAKFNITEKKMFEYSDSGELDKVWIPSTEIKTRYEGPAYYLDNIRPLEPYGTCLQYIQRSQRYDGYTYSFASLYPPYPGWGVGYGANRDWVDLRNEWELREEYKNNYGYTEGYEYKYIHDGMDTGYSCYEADIMMAYKDSKGNTQTRKVGEISPDVTITYEDPSGNEKSYPSYFACFDYWNTNLDHNGNPYPPSGGAGELLEARRVFNETYDQFSVSNCVIESGLFKDRRVFGFDEYVPNYATLVMFSTAPYGSIHEKAAGDGVALAFPVGLYNIAMFFDMDNNTFWDYAGMTDRMFLAQYGQAPKRTVNTYFYDSDSDGEVDIVTSTTLPGYNGCKTMAVEVSLGDFTDDYGDKRNFCYSKISTSKEVLTYVLFGTEIIVDTVLTGMSGGFWATVGITATRAGMAYLAYHVADVQEYWPD